MKGIRSAALPSLLILVLAFPAASQTDNSDSSDDPAAAGQAGADPALAQPKDEATEAGKEKQKKSIPSQVRTPPSLKKVPRPDEPERLDLEAKPMDPKTQDRMTLFIGLEEQRTLPFLPAGAKFKGDFKKVAKVLLDKDTNTLAFQGVKAGFGTLTITDENDRHIYDIFLDVKENQVTRVASEMRTLLADIEGITIKIVNNRVVVDGQVILPRDMSRIIAVVNQYGDKIASNLTTLSPGAQQKMAKLIESHINNPEITVKAVNDKFILEGQVNDQGEKDKAFALAQMYVPNIIKEAGEKSGDIVVIKKEFVINLISVRQRPPPEPGKIIQLVVHFVEMSKSYSKGFRFQFTPQLEDKSQLTITSDSRQPGSVVSTLTAVVSNLLPKLNWAKEHGHARVLQSMTLQVLDNTEGNLVNETSIPFTTFTSENRGVSKDFPVGMRVNITPQVINQRSDSIDLKMDFSLKQLVDMSDSGPIVSNSAVKSRLVVRSGQSAAVGGLILNSNLTSYNKFPKGVDNPIISLYASKNFQRKQSQFVVFITPIIKASASQGSERVKQKFRLKD